jgi:septal ring factor EnvC (AmiA/AmiB activator)
MQTDQRGVFGRPVRSWVVLVLLGVAALGTVWAEEGRSGDVQLGAVRSRIRQYEKKLASIEREAESMRRERERLQTEVNLAEARVEEVELELTSSRNEIVRLKEETAAISVELERRKAWLSTHLELVSLLGKPGPLQLFWDGARGGHLEDAVGVVVTLTAGQAQMVREYNHMQTDRAARQAELSRTLERAGREMNELGRRRESLEKARKEMDRRLDQLNRQEHSAENRLEEMRAREAALERLMSVVGKKKRFTGAEDIRRYRGALPWPASGKVVRTFGKHYLPRYATYTVCNGLRLAVAPGVPVTALFPGQVAYARFFKGYGNMVVVDHGGEVFSLVAGLSSIHARMDQRVEMGTPLGVAGLEKDEGNLYLEIRVGGKPQDPRKWLQLK